MPDVIKRDSYPEPPEWPPKVADHLPAYHRGKDDFLAGRTPAVNPFVGADSWAWRTGWEEEQGDMPAPIVRQD